MAVAQASTAAATQNGTVNDFELKSYRQLTDGTYTKQVTSAVGDWGYSSSSTATTTVHKTGTGQLRNLIVLGGALGAITIYDGVDNTGAVIAPTFTPGAAGTTTFDISFKTGLTIVTAAATALTVTIR